MQNDIKKQPKPKKRVLTGIVISDKMQKTIIVQVKRLSHHSRYDKIMKKYSSFKVHDEKNEAKVGDTVKIIETRPISKDKRWRLYELLK